MSIANSEPEKLPSRFEDLVAVMPPQAIMDDAQHDEVLEIVDRLMARRRLTKGQAAYLETLVQLVEVYEAKQHAVDTAELSGIEALKELLAVHAMNASDLARLLGVHPSMGSKLLKGERSLTVDHLMKLGKHFHVHPQLFMPAG